MGVEAVEVDGVAPLIVIAVGKVVVGVAAERVSVQTEIVIYKVTNNFQAKFMGSVNKALERLGVAVIMRRRIEINAVIAPIPTPGEFGDWHELDKSNAQALEFRQFARGSVERPFGGERADVQLYR